MNDRIAFVTVAVHSKNYDIAYLRQQDRLVKSIKRVYGDEAEIFQWRDCYPPGSRDWLTSQYGFKPHAVQFAKDEGFNKVCYMDTAMILEKKLDCDHLVEQYGILAVIDESKMSGVTWDKACEYFGVTRDWLEGKTLVGGSFYYFNFQNDQCIKMFEAWKLAEQKGIFGSQDGESAGIQNGHRADETCMSIVLHLNGSKPCGYEDVGYQGEIMRKEHFR